MIRSIPTTEPPKSGVGEETGKIAVVVFTAPDDPTVTLCLTYLNALASALRRDSIPVIDKAPVFSALFVVAVFTIPWSQRGAARAVLKQTANELGFPHPSPTIALKKCDGEWLTHTGVDSGRSGFDEIFLRDEFIDATEAALVSHVKRAADFQSFLRAEFPSAFESTDSGENPESP